VNDLLYKGNPQARAVTSGRSTPGGRFRIGESQKKRFVHEKTTSIKRYAGMHPSILRIMTDPQHISNSISTRMVNR
jgi:hypothetical protein